MKLSALDLKGIVMSGGGLIIDASHYSTLDLKGIAMTAVSSENNSKIILKNLQGKSALDLKGIAMSGEGCVIFDLT